MDHLFEKLLGWNHDFEPFTLRSSYYQLSNWGRM